MKNRIGIVGGGQLGRMLGIAAKQLGFYVTVMDAEPNSPAGQVVDQQIVAPVTDEHAIRQLAAISDYLTFEVELANAAVLSDLAQQGKLINPAPETLTMIKDKYRQKEFLSSVHITTAKHIAVTSGREIEQAIKRFKYPVVLKARTDAYDGRGNAIIKKKSDIPIAMKKLKGRSLYVEQWVPFIKELAVMAARDMSGNIVTYPVVETVHKNNICHIVFAPAKIDTKIQKKATKLAKQVMNNLQGAGVFGIEMFLTKQGDVLVNELAPRVHNSGHYTIEACITNQFEQHIRAVTGLPLGNPAMKMPAAVMVNILGERTGPVDLQGVHSALSISNLGVHIYGKKETRKERKMGHLTAVDTTIEKAYKKAKLARAQIHI